MGRDPGSADTGILTARQKAILHFIATYVRENGYPPTTREIADATKLRSQSTVHYNLAILRDLGYITVQAGSPRTIKIIRKAP